MRDAWLPGAIGPLDEQGNLHVGTIAPGRRTCPESPPGPLPMSH